MKNGSTLLAAMALVISGCASSGLPAISSGERYMSVDAQTESYPLGAGDKVRVTVFNEPTLSGEFSVSSDGDLAMPLIGNIKALGKTTNQVTTLLQEALANGYLRDPKVSMEVVTYRPFFILGEVKAPGQYPYASGMTVINAIATAEGFTPRAKIKTVMIRRFGEVAEQEFLLTPDLRVWPGDTLRLTERYF